MDATNPDLKTFNAWLQEGRTTIRGSRAEYYLLNDDRTSARGLFRRDQTQPLGTTDVAEAEGWTVVVTAGEWEQLKAERKAAARGPRVKIRRPATGGTEIWCGPDVDIIRLLKSGGYTYQASSRYWFHPNKDAETTAKAFEQGKVRGQRVRVTRDWDDPEGPAL